MDTSSSPPSLVFTSNPVYLRITNYMTIFPAVILVYDHVLTFAQELERIWQRKLTINTALFLVLRYGTLLGMVFILMAPVAISVIATTMVMSIRTIALYEGNRYLAATFGLLLATQFICHCVLTQAIFWLSPLVVDTIIFGSTLFKLQRFSKDVRERLTLFEVILRDGIMYYAVIFCINLVIALNYLLSPVEMKIAGASLALCMSTTMTSRLVLNLQGVSATYDSVRTMSTSQSEDGPIGVLTTAPSVFFDQNQGPLADPNQLSKV
ncbi:hypothetical protein BU17DRAFT_66924 [Hysterangium stoloniferum]|nr:hypothetical protein BU17DRAFT_66924 [Hysterangium stoloniferum]